MRIVIIATVEDNAKIPDSATWDCETAVRETLEKHGVAVSNMNSRKEKERSLQNE